MFRIIKISGKTWVVEVEKGVKVFWFFTKTEWSPYDFGTAEGTTIGFESYHHALQQLLLAIEKDLNLKYMDNEMRD